jgi:hypothetical protein
MLAKRAVVSACFRCHKMVHGGVLNVKCYLINHLLSTILSRQYFVFLFRRETEQLHQDKMKTRGAIPNTTKVVCYQIRLDLVVATLFFWT